MTIFIGSDHAGYALKQEVIKLCKEFGEIKDVGCNSEESCDYPDYAHALAKELKDNPESKGILICGSGNGISIAANKHQHVRAALCWTEELAALAVQHNNANVLSLPARFINEDLALDIVRAFFNNQFEGGRHERRTNKIPVA